MEHPGPQAPLKTTAQAADDAGLITVNILETTQEIQAREAEAKRIAAQLYIEKVVEHLPVSGECLNAPLSMLSQAISLKRIADSLEKLVKFCEQEQDGH